MYYINKDFNMYYEIHGSGKKSIVILPGWGNTRETFELFINYFREKYRIIIIDYPGFGKSSFPKRDLDINDYAQLIKEFLEDLGIFNPIIIAHSFGGRIATLLSSKYHIKIEKMVFMDVAGLRRKSLKRWFKVKIYKINKFLIKTFVKKQQEKHLEKLRKKYGSSDYNSLTDEMVKTFSNIVNEDLRKYIPNIKEELLLLWGMNDCDTPLKDGYYFNKKVDNSALIIFPRGTHFVYLEYPCTVCKIIESFVEN